MRNDQPELRQLLRELNSTNEQTHAAAERKIRALPPESFLPLCQLETEHYRRRRRTALRRMAMTAAAELLAIIGGSLFDPDPATPYLLTALFLEFDVIMIFPILWAATVPIRAHRKLQNILAARTEPEFVGIYLTVLSEYVNKSKLEAREGRQLCDALKRLLPQLSADQGRKLIPAQRQTLRDLLRFPYLDVDLTLAILKTLEQIGDGSDRQRVEALASESRVTPRMKRVRDAARECLPYLQNNAERSRQSQTLLRASDGESRSAPDTLLRPAHSAETSAPEQLLRAAKSAGTQE